MSVALSGAFAFDRTVAVGRAASRRRQTLRTLVWTIVLLLAAEGVLRVRAWHRHGVAGPVADLYEEHAELGRRPKAGALVVGSQRHVSINRWGFRGADLEQAKPPGTFRIAAIGDSTTFGLEAGSDAAVWVARLGERLRESGNANVETINAAVPGYTLAMSADRLLRDVALFDPDVVVVMNTATDIAAHSRREFSANRLSGDASRLEQLLEEHSLLINLLRQNAAPLLARWMPSGRHDRLDERGFLEYADRLIQVVDECRRREWCVALCTTPRSFGGPGADQHALAGSALLHNPSLSLAGLNDAYDRYNEVVREVARRTHAVLVDLDRLVPRGNACFVDATHLNDTGHALVAEQLAGALSAIVSGRYAADGQAAPRDQAAPAPGSLAGDERG